MAIFAAKKNLRLLITGGAARSARARASRCARVAGGLLVQSRDDARGRRQRSQGRDQARADRRARLRDLLFAFRVAKHVKSNAIVYAKDGATVGIGAGQMSRVDSARIAACKARTPPRRRG